MSDVMQAPERKGLTISEQDIPFSAYQAIYHKLTKKVEKLSKDFKDPYDIKFEDIKNLDQRFRQSLAQYAVKGSRCEISHSTKGGFSRVHSSFEKFQISDNSARECTSSFSYQLDFLVVLPAQIPQAEELAQRYKVEIIFEQDMIDESDRKKLPYFLRGFFSLGSLKVDIEYTDYAVAQSLEATVQSWVNQLPKRKESKFHKVATFFEPAIMQFSGAVAATLALVGGAWRLSQIDVDAQKAAIIILVCFAAATLTAPFVHWLCSTSYKTIKKTAPCPTISLTQGDRDRISKIDDVHRKAEVLIGVLMVGCVLSFAVNLLAAMVFDKVFS